ncbi:hypothetical protein BD410DRAFT_808238 [Rickenella mellea]|uniref:Uncharacterized protein n=1 Tax=Rickenella mellea TaxID=50990 RepID=A0A4Y7PLI8_9AGAM|nr:hypothetical protein BD410DRAFT_808238 [Rickenella mellea]
MAPASWANEAELKWLRETLPLFLQSSKKTGQKTGQKTGKASGKKESTRGPFWVKAYQDYFTAFPLPPFTQPALPCAGGNEVENQALIMEMAEVTVVDPMIELRRTQIATWFKNNTGNASRKQIRTMPKVTDKAKKTRLPQPVEIFQKLYYKTLVKADVDLEVAAQKELPEKDRLERLTIMKAKAQAAWAAASDEIIQEVEEMRKGLEEEKADQLCKPDEDQPVVERSPDEIQKAIDNIAPYLQPFLDQLAAETDGWEFFVLCSGREPRNNDKFKVISLQTGKKEFGNTFATAHPRFNQDICTPFLKFAKKLHPRKPRVVLDVPPLDDVNLHSFSRSVSPAADELPSGALLSTMDKPSTITIIEFEPRSRSPKGKRKAKAPTKQPKPRISAYEQERLDKVAENKKLLATYLGTDMIFPPRPVHVPNQRKQAVKGMAATRRSRSLHSPTCPPGLHLDSCWSLSRVQEVLEFQSRLSEDSTKSPPGLHLDSTWNLYQ